METSKNEVENHPVVAGTAPPVFPGFRFSPTDQELILYYLRRKIEGSLDKSVEIISELDICKHEPWDLPGKSMMESDCEWYFFSPRVKKYPNGSQSLRATETGYWKATGKEREVKSGSELIGTKRTLVFHVGRAPKGSRTEWIMHEYCMAGRSQDSLLVCRLRKKIESTSTPNTNTNIISTGEEVSNGTSRPCAGGGGSNPSMNRFVDSDVPGQAEGEGFGSDVHNRGTTASGDADEIRSVWMIGSGSTSNSSTGSSSYGSHSIEHSRGRGGDSSHKSTDESVHVTESSALTEISIPLQLNRGGNTDEEDDYFAEILNDYIVILDDDTLPPPPPQPPSSKTVIRQTIATNHPHQHQAAAGHKQTATVVESLVYPIHHQLHGTANRRIRLKTKVIKMQHPPHVHYHDVNENSQEAQDGVVRPVVSMEFSTTMRRRQRRVLPKETNNCPMCLVMVAVVLLMCCYLRRVLMASH